MPWKARLCPFPSLTNNFGMPCSPLASLPPPNLGKLCDALLSPGKPCCAPPSCSWQALLKPAKPCLALASFVKPCRCLGKPFNPPARPAQPYWGLPATAKPREALRNRAESWCALLSPDKLFFALLSSAEPF
eukprot:9479318-Pyramimonas_sp.AAC.2